MYIIEVLTDVFKEIFRYEKVIALYEKGGGDAFLNFDGITMFISFLIPLVIVYEIIAGIFIYKRPSKGFWMPFLFKIVNRVIGQFVIIGMLAFCIKFFGQYALFQTTFTWYWCIYAYVVWEFGHFLYHYWGHKVRLFWCFHGQHHAPEEMNLTVNWAHFFLEGPYAHFIRTTTCILLGLSPEMLLAVMAIDSIWGELIHLSEDTLKKGDLGFLGKFILTPMHHRVHHSKNALYMDTNFCNLLNIWDRVFGTYQEQIPEEKPVYGVTRPVDTTSIIDMYFGELIGLGKDVIHAPGIINKLKYIFMPPGWSHTGNHQLAADLRKDALVRYAK